MRVLVDCRMASWAGVGRYATGLTRALAARDDVELIQVCSQGAAPPVPPGSGVEVVTATAHPFGARGALELGRVARMARPDLVHCLHFPTPAPSRLPLVVTIHDLIPLVVEGVMPSRPKRWVYRRWNGRAARLADTLIVPSRATAVDVGRLFPAARHRLVVTAEAADDFSTGPVEEPAGRLADIATPPYVFSMGNTRPHKDLPVLFEAFARVAAARPGLRLVLAGTEPPGYLGARLASAAPGLQARVAFTGPVSDAQLRTLYATAEAFVFPSRYEGFGLPVLEAMAMSAPVVCADAASLPEVAGEAALLVAPGNAESLTRALERVLDDPDLQARLRDAGRARAAQFSWARTADETVAVYADVLARGPRARSQRGQAA